MIRHTLRDGYNVFHWPDQPDRDLTDHCKRYPDLVVGRFLVNTSFDSGFLSLSREEESQGWFMIGTLAHSPQIQSVSQVPHDQYDEWLAFETQPRVTDFETLVNFLEFNPIDFTWKEKLERFWEQLGKLQPLHLIGENGTSYIVTRDAALASRIMAAEQVEDR